MGRFSTAAQYFLEPTGKLDDQSGKFEVGYTKASKKFLEELQETYIHPVWDLIKSGQDPMNVFRDPAKNVCLELPVEKAKFGQGVYKKGEIRGGNSAKYSPLLRQMEEKAPAEATAR